MVEQQKTSDNKSGKFKSALKNLLYLRFWLLVAWVIFFSFLVVYASRVFPNKPDQYTFFAQQMFNGLVFTAVVIQALIYRGQLRVMGIAIDPRLRISQVEAVNFELDRTPIFIVTLVNEGATDAENVAMFLKAELIGEGTGTHLIKQQVTTIPAHGKREYFVRWSGPLNQTLIDEVKSGAKPLEITGSYEYARSKSVPFCYRYYVWPWPEDRPERLPQFLPCDLSTAQNFFVTPRGVEVKAMLGNVGVKIEKGPQGKIRPTGELSLEHITGPKTKSDSEDAKN